MKAAISALAALGQDTRLEVVQLLACHEIDGLSSGDLARQLEVPQSTMSVHLKTLTQAGLVRSERHGRSKIFRTDHDKLAEVSLYLIENCCYDGAKLILKSLKEHGA